MNIAAGRDASSSTVWIEVRRLEQWSAVTCRPGRCSHGDVYLVDPLQPRGTGAREHVDNARGRTHAAERQQSGALEFAMTQELPARHVKQSAQIQIVSS